MRTPFLPVRIHRSNRVRWKHAPQNLGVVVLRTPPASLLIPECGFPKVKAQSLRLPRPHPPTSDGSRGPGCQSPVLLTTML